jgi:CspA family cold shock protein
MTPECGDKDLFTHFSEIKGSVSKTLAESQRAEFEVMLGPKGPQASNTRALA